MAGYQDQNVSISPHQIRMGGQVFPPSMVRSITVVDTSAGNRGLCGLIAIGALLFALMIAGSGGHTYGHKGQDRIWIFFAAIAGFFGFLWFAQIKWPVLELRVWLHSGGGKSKFSRLGLPEKNRARVESRSASMSGTLAR